MGIRTIHRHGIVNRRARSELICKSPAATMLPNIPEPTKSSPFLYPRTLYWAGYTCCRLYAVFQSPWPSVHYLKWCRTSRQEHENQPLWKVLPARPGTRTTQCRISPRGWHQHKPHRLPRSSSTDTNVDRWLKSSAGSYDDFSHSDYISLSGSIPAFKIPILHWTRKIFSTWVARGNWTKKRLINRGGNIFFYSRKFAFTKAFTKRHLINRDCTIFSIPENPYLRRRLRRNTL